MNNLFDLEGRVAVVTGASSGLGADAAVAYAEYGADVAILARRTDKLADTAAKIEALGKRVLPIACDVTDEDSVKAAVDATMKEFGKIDILLNNAGMFIRGGVDKLTTDEWNTVIATDLTSLYYTGKYIVPIMKEQNYGKIVNVASINAAIVDKAAGAARHAYNSAKAGVIGMTKGMAGTYGANNITVNAIGPGLFETEITENTLYKNQEWLNWFSSICPMERPSRKGELNGTVIYFSSEASAYVTGQFVIVDGGFGIV